MTSIRAFFALPMSPATEYELATATNVLRTRQPHLAGAGELRWISPANYHLTLAFLGNIQPSAVETLHQIARDVAARHWPETLFINRLDWFPSPIKARLIVAMPAASRVLQALQKDLVRQLLQQGFHCPGEPFRAHISLARSKGQVTACNLDSEPIQSALDMDELVLYRSDSADKGVVYTPLFTESIGR